MFLTNKYTLWYYSIIHRANARILNSSIYTEKHHIIPKSMGGSNDLSNIAILTGREHFICHLLLLKMVEQKYIRSMWYASYMMCKGSKRYKPTARIYEKLKQHMISANKDRPGPNLGKIFSAEARANMSAATKGKPKGPFTEDHINNMRKPKTEEHKMHLSESRLGKSCGYQHTDETKEKMSVWQKGIPKEKIKCEFCGKETSQMNYKRWHGIKCKNHPNFVKRDIPKKECNHCNKIVDLANFGQWHGDKCKSLFVN